MTGFLSAVCLTAVSLASMPVTVSATNILGDINNDGYIDITDSVALNRYLAGLVPASSINLRNADLDRNVVIDVNDSKIFMSFLLGTIDEIPYSESGNTYDYSNYSIPNDSTRSYIKYDCDTGTQSTYTLSQASPISTTAGSTDDRVIDSSSNAQCIVRLEYNGGQGSGFIVDDHVIATCAHCVYNNDPDNPSFKTNYSIKVYNAAGTSVVATYYPKELHIPDAYKTSSSGWFYDYGLIYVEEDLSAYGNMALGTMANNFPYTAQTVSVSGFPGTVNEEPTTSRYCGTGNITLNPYNSPTDLTTRNYNLFYTAYANAGDSGGPVYIDYTFKGQTFRSAIGIHTLGYSDGTTHSGVRITLPLLRFYNSNSNIG